MIRKKFLWLLLLPMIGLQACNLPSSQEPVDAPLYAVSTREPIPASVDISPGNRIQPEDIIYLGAFRLPEGSGGSSWDYSGHGLTYYPEGDPGGGEDGFPGSLFGYGHDQQLMVSEISIPLPVVSQNFEELNTGTTLQPFTDITEGLFDPSAVDIPRAGSSFF